MLKGVTGFVVGTFARGITAERENIADRTFSVTRQNGLDLVLFMANAGQVRNGIELGRGLNSLDKIVSQVAG